jgi:hypothetical protein
MSEPVVKFSQDWRDRHDGEEYNLTLPSGQEEFLAEATSLLRHIAHTARSASIYTVTDQDSISTVFIRITR